MRYVIVGIALLLVWGLVTVLFQAPGWVHILLSAGVAFWVYGVVTPAAQKSKQPPR